MKFAKLKRIAAVGFFTLLSLPVQLAAQDEEDHRRLHHQYKLIDMGSLGGPQSYLQDGLSGSFSVAAVNNQGTLAGWADTSEPDPFPPNFCFDSDCFLAHAFQWQNGVKTDLGTLPGGASSLASWVGANGWVAGLAENGEIDPLAAGFPQLRAVTWQSGEITDLGVLEGGFESEANAVNGRGQAVGAFTNTVPDPNSMFGLGYQTRAFSWQDGTMQDLGSLGAGTDAQAQFVNERGQVIGWYYTSSAPNTDCASTFPLATGSFIWEKATGMVDLGTFGGTCTVATGINDRGKVVGISVTADHIERAFLWDRGSFQDLGGSFGGTQIGAEGLNDRGQTAGWATLPGESTFHAALWKHVGGLTDLGVLSKDSCSLATSINGQTQVVGASMPDCSIDNTSRAFLWEDGSMLNLNALIPPSAPLHLQWAQDINDRGEIAGMGILPNGDGHVFLLIPCDENHPSVEGCDYSLVHADAAARENPASVVPTPRTTAPRTNNFGRMPWRRLGPLSGIRQLAPADSGRSSNSTEVGSGPHILTPTRAGSGTESTPATEAGTSLRITSGNPPSGAVGRLYDLRWGCPLPCFLLLAGFPVTAAGGLKPYSWRMTAQPGSSLPPGLFFPDTLGYECLHVSPPAICGKPSTAGDYNVVITVTDSESPPRHASKSYTIHI
jgi:probable HAF family extracellular repeat protein